MSKLLPPSVVDTLPKEPSSTLKLAVGLVIVFITFSLIKWIRSIFRSPFDAIPMSAPPPKPSLPIGDITLESLRMYAGYDPGRLILLAVRGVVYDVTSGKDFYGPKGGYHVFAGKECARALAKVSTAEVDVTGDIADLNPDQMQTLLQWEEKFKAKYPIVGQVVPLKLFSPTELEAFNGKQPDKPMYMAVASKVYDVSNARNFYGPEGMYPFAGKECARALAKMSLEAADLNGNVSDLSPGERDTLENWIGKFDFKYKIVGKLVA